MMYAWIPGDVNGIRGLDSLRYRGIYNLHATDAYRAGTWSYRRRRVAWIDVYLGYRAGLCSSRYLGHMELDSLMD